MQGIWTPYNIILWTVKQFKIAVAFNVLLKKFKLRELQEFCRGVAEESILQGYDTISGGSWNQTFLGNIVSSPSRVRGSMNHGILRSSYSYELLTRMTLW